jgi:hypothetical protein
MPSATRRRVIQNDAALSAPALPHSSPRTVSHREALIREELIKHRQCLHAMSEQFSPRTLAQVDQAIGHTLERLGELCGHCDCDRIVSCLLRQLDQVTNLSAWSDPKTHH